MASKNINETLGIPKDHKPDYDDLLEACIANAVWFFAENNSRGTFYDRMDMCSFAEWTTKKALGIECSKKWEGVPRLLLELKP
jgi:hypothetical protein